MVQQPVTFFIITTLYNSSATLKVTLDSLLHQTNSNFVHYLYDDGSPEPSDSMIQDYLAAVSKLPHPYRVIYERGSHNLGVDLAHQVAFRKISCPYFLWLDSGDYLKANFFAIATKAISQHPDCSLFNTNRYTYRPEAVEHRSAGSYLSQSVLRQEDQLPNFIFGEDFLFSEMIIKTAAFKEVNPNDVILNGKEWGGLYYDDQIFYAMFLSGCKSHYISQPISYKLDDPKSASKVNPLSGDLALKGLIHYVTLLNFPEVQKQRLRDCLSLRELILSVEGLVLQNKTAEAIEAYRSIKPLMIKQNLPTTYFLRKARTKRFYFLARHPFFLHLYRRYRHLPAC